MESLSSDSAGKKHREACILAIGNELLNGAVVDANSAFVAKELRDIGILVKRTVHVPDDLEVIVEEVQAAAQRFDVILTSGGLGPTSDDLTRDALATAAQKPLEFDQEAYQRLEVLLAKRNRQVNENNRRQTYFPSGSEVLPNSRGTADAFICNVPGGKSVDVPVIALPGVPPELRELLRASVIPWLQRKFPDSVSAEMYTVKCFGLSESYIGSRIEQLRLPAGVEVAYRPSFPEILLVFTIDCVSGAARESLEEAARLVTQDLGEEFVFAHNSSSSLPEVVLELFKERGLSIAAAESCSGGMLASELIAHAGASEVLRASLVTYSNSAKEVFLGVKRALLRDCGAVSEQVALAMAQGAKHRSGADYAISISGISGPDGGTEAKPVGTTCFGLVSASEELSFVHVFPWSRNMNRKYSVWIALDLLRRKVLGLPLTWEQR